MIGVAFLLLLLLFLTLNPPAAKLHTPWGFTALGHNLHHTSKAGCAATAMYMAPIDFFIQIVAPYGAFLILFKTDWRFDILLASIGSVAAMYEHSGYCFTKWKTLDTTMHFSHHLGRVHGSLSEGVLSPGYCDMIFGTKLSGDEFSNYQTPDAVESRDNSSKKKK